MSTATGAYETHGNWKHWPVYWSAIWVGALTALAVALLVGLIGTAVGAQAAHRDVELTGVLRKDVTFWAMAFAIVGGFLAFAAGGWVAGKIGGILRSEPAILHGAIVWLVAVPLLLGVVSLGAGSSFGGWYSGLASTPAWTTQPVADRGTALTDQPTNSGTDTTSADAKDRAARVARNTALCTLTALLMGLMGSVVGGWMASGEPLTFTHHRTRDLARVSGSTGTAGNTRITSPTSGQESYLNR